MESKYFQVLKKLYQVNRFKNTKISLENMQKIALIMGNPQKDLNFIHIAGTNGKGSVALKSARILQNSSLKVGLFVSPHISTFRERITVNGKLIDQTYIADIFTTLFGMTDQNNIDLSYFEYITIAALLYFKEQKVDIISWETGLGGSLDATNIVDPLISVITSIGFDHMDTLGYTLDEIAAQKAGIIKPNRPAVIGPHCPYEIFKRKAKLVGAPLYRVEPDKTTEIDFDKENQKITKKVIEVLGETYPKFKVSNESIELGIISTQSCRLEYIHPKQYAKIKEKFLPEYIILDVGHNAPAVERALMTLRTRHPDHKIRVLYGTSAKKDAFSTLQNIAQYAHKIHLIHSNHARSMDINTLIDIAQTFKSELTANSAKNLFEQVIENGNIAKTLNYAFEQCSKGQNKEIFLITGSFYIMQEARLYFDIRDENDPFELNEMIAPEDRKKQFRKGIR